MSENSDSGLSVTTNLASFIIDNSTGFSKQEAFEKCWAHSLLRAVLHSHSPGVATAPLSHAACASMSMTTTTTTPRDRGDHYGPVEWAQ